MNLEQPSLDLTYESVPIKTIEQPRFEADFPQNDQEVVFKDASFDDFTFVKEETSEYIIPDQQIN